MTKEEVYDSQIAPLMGQILAICKQHKIAMLASFSIPNEEDEGLLCSSALLEDEYEPPEAFLRALGCLVQQSPTLRMTVRNADGTADVHEQWYDEDSIAHSIQESRSIVSFVEGRQIPTDVYSPEFARWLTHQYRLAMAKGIQIGREQEKAAVDAMQKGKQ